MIQKSQAHFGKPGTSQVRLGETKGSLHSGELYWIEEMGLHTVLFVNKRSEVSSLASSLFALVASFGETHLRGLNLQTQNTRLLRQGIVGKRSLPVERPYSHVARLALPWMQALERVCFRHYREPRRTAHD
jgi:hypothetical protein